jgi:Carboxypeptidase regulatory-like domain
MFDATDHLGKFRVIVALLAVLALGALLPGRALADVSMTGEVTNAATGNPIAGATVYIYNASDPSQPIIEMPSENNGSFLTGSLPNGSYDVEVDGSSQGYAIQWYNGATSQSGATAVTVSGTTITPSSVNLALTPDAISGTVTASGSGLSGVEVELVTSANKQVAQTTTDTSGRYAFSPVPPAAGDVVVFNPGGANGSYTSSASSPFNVLPGQQVTENGQVGPSSGTVSGTVTDQLTGADLAGVEVELINSSHTEIAQTTSNAVGYYSFSAVPAANGDEVLFNPGGVSNNFGSSTSFPFNVIAGQQQTVNGQLLSGGVIGGHVTNSGSQAIQGVTVYAQNTATNNSYNATTSSGGTYLLDGLPAGSYKVQFQPANGQNYITQWYLDKSDYAAAVPVSVTSGHTTANVDATLASGATISGVVTSGATHTPLAGVYVEVSNYTDDFIPNLDTSQVRTAADGSYTLIGLPPGTYDVEFSPQYPSNYLSEYYNQQTNENKATPIALAAGATRSSIDAALPTGGEISGKVTNAQGQPLQNVEAYVVDTGGTFWGSADTASDGTYTIPALPTSGSFRVGFDAPEGSPYADEFYSGAEALDTARAVPVTQGNQTSNIDASLPLAGTISGALTDAATGTPIGEDGVSVYDVNGGESADENFSGTAQDGTYEIPNLLPGTYKVLFEGEGSLASQYFKGASSLAAATVVTVKPSQTTAGINGALVTGGEISGTVRSASTGAGLADSEVSLIDSNGHFQNGTRSDPNGHYTMTGIPAGTYYVQFFAEDDLHTYQTLYYRGAATLAGAKPVSIKAGSTIANINVSLPIQSAPPKPGPPTLSGGSISGLANSNPNVKFTVTAGSNGAPKLKTLKIQLPNGLSFVNQGLAHGVSVSGAQKVSKQLQGGQLLVTLGSPASPVSVSLSSPALKESATLVGKAKAHKIGSLIVKVTVTPATGSPVPLSFTVNNPASARDVSIVHPTRAILDRRTNDRQRSRSRDTVTIRRDALRHSRRLSRQAVATRREVRAHRHVSESHGARHL